MDAAKRFTLKRLEIEEGEPHKLKILDLICHNELVQALGLDESELVRIGSFQQMAAQFFPFEWMLSRR